VNNTLLLNASYEPIKVISWKKAISLFFLENVEVVENYDSDIRSVSISIKMPAVVRLLRYVKISHRKPPLSKINLLARDEHRCQYCGKALDYKSATLDHVVPRSQQGVTSWENVVIACGQCNRKKGGRTPEQANMRLKKPPASPDWLPVVDLHVHRTLPNCWLIFLGENDPLD